MHASNGKVFHPSSSTPRSLVYRLRTTRGMIDALLDSGADVSLISESSVQKRGIATTPLDKPIDVVLANRSRQRATRCVSTLTLARGPWEDQIRCVVVPNLAGPLFLGRDWLSKWNPVIDWVTGELTVPNAGGPWLPKGDYFGGREACGEYS